MSNDINPDPEFFSTTTFIQIGYGLWVSLVHILIGLAICFPTNVMPQLIDDPAFSMVKSEEAWIGRTVVGVGCGMGMGTPCAYITEMSLPNVRGVIVVFTTIALCIGLTIQELIGASFKWNELCYGYAIVSVGIGISETSDLTLEEIEEYFNERRPTLVSQRSVIVAQKSQALLHNLGSKAPVSKQSLVEIMSPKTSGKGS
ncbi:unnamed protein product [Diatraea saccharalis]|uniref:Major facilitator superfamily (MFS) profile domain-containing protein n=1 Tax=Diatraea saccharalis TaxID=40085 RepID=A0A9N9QWS1_9NEOP|nr:unnamed protein product [Diatraea saccharalis]